MRKGKIKFIVLMLLLVIFLIIGATYAYVRIVVLGTKTSFLSAGELHLNLIEGVNSISLPGVIPMTVEDGMKQDAFTFSLENDGTEDSYYTIYLINDSVSDEALRIDDKYINYHFTKTKNGTVENFTFPVSSLETDLITIDSKQITGRVLDTGLIEATNSSKIDYSLKFWLDYDADNSVMRKEFAVKLYIIADQVRDKLVINGDGTGANVPEVASGMIPVIYDGENWVKADITNANKSWFDYETQKWANAVTVVEKGINGRLYYEGAPNGTVIPMEDINTMWVWIPRYSYTIKSENGKNFYGKGSTNRALPGEIDVKFISKTEKDTGTAQYIGSTASNYLTMPGFTFGTEELSGIWVGKFETSSGYDDNKNSGNVLIKPDVLSWRNIEVADMYQLGRGLQQQESVFGFSNDTNDLDSHMMKNSEWGIVAFLSQSKYGKYGNDSYDGAEKAIFINNSSSYFTGRSGGSYCGNTSISETYTSSSNTLHYKEYGFYSYDDYLLDYSTGTKTTKVTGKGTGASTTGNIYGVYDMSGGALEYVMANHQNYSGYTAREYTADEALAALNYEDGAVGIWNSGFNGRVFGPDYNEETGEWDIQMIITEGIDFPDAKYYDLYTTDNHLTACSGGPCRGQSYETGSWSGASWDFGDVSYPWVYRGGYSKHGAGAGIFYSRTNDGRAVGSTSFRIVLVVSN